MISVRKNQNTQIKLENSNKKTVRNKELREKKAEVHKDAESKSTSHMHVCSAASSPHTQTHKLFCVLPHLPSTCASQGLEEGCGPVERFHILPVFPQAELRVSVSYRTASVILCPTVPSCVHLYNIYLSNSDSISFGRALTEKRRLLFKGG